MEVRQLATGWAQPGWLLFLSRIAALRVCGNAQRSHQLTRCSRCDGARLPPGVEEARALSSEDEVSELRSRCRAFEDQNKFLNAEIIDITHQREEELKLHMEEAGQM